MDVQSIQLQGGQRFPVVHPGRFFILIQADAPLDVSFVKNNSPSGEVGRNVVAGYKRMPGDWSNPEAGKFESVVLNSATAQTVIIGISQEAADYRATLGVVQIEQANDGGSVPDQVVSDLEVEVSAASANVRRVHVQNVSTVGNARVAPATAAANQGNQLRPGASFTYKTTAAINAIREGANDVSIAVTTEERT